MIAVHCHLCCDHRCIMNDRYLDAISLGSSSCWPKSRVPADGCWSQQPAWVRLGGGGGSGLLRNQIRSLESGEIQPHGCDPLCCFMWFSSTVIPPQPPWLKLLTSSTVSCLFCCRGREQSTGVQFWLVHYSGMTTLHVARPLAHLSLQRKREEREREREREFSRVHNWMLYHQETE